MSTLMSFAEEERRRAVVLEATRRLTSKMFSPDTQLLVEELERCHGLLAAIDAELRAPLMWAGTNWGFESSLQHVLEEYMKRAVPEYTFEPLDKSYFYRRRT